MSKLETIESDLAALSANDLTCFRDWFETFGVERYDRGIEADINGSKLDELAHAFSTDVKNAR